MYECGSWTIKKAECQKIDAFELWCWRRLLRVPWTARSSNQSILNEISPECSLEGLIPEAETPILWPPEVKNWLIGKDPDARKDWRQEEKRTTEDEMAGWYQRLEGHKFGQTPGVGWTRDGQESLLCCSPWGGKESNITERLNWTEALTLLDEEMQHIGETALQNQIVLDLLTAAQGGMWALLSTECFVYILDNHKMLQ